MAGLCEGRVAIVAGGWSTGQISEALRDLLAKAAPNANIFGTVDDLTEA